MPNLILFLIMSNSVDVVLYLTLVKKHSIVSLNVPLKIYLLR